MDGMYYIFLSKTILELIILKSLNRGLVINCNRFSWPF